jgi:transcriptional regulator with XRE-family HTH domain
MNGITCGIVNRTIPEEADRVHIAEKFERLLDAYRRPDGRRWNGAELQKATGGVVIRSYVTNLRKGRIESPGYDKLRAIAKAMDFPPAVWFEEDLGGGVKVEPQGVDLADRLEHLFGAIKNPTTEKPYSNAEIARMSAGDLSEEDVEGIRTGRIADPSVGQVGALASAFGVEPSYLLDRSTDGSVLDGELVEALRDGTVRKITRESSRLPGREKEMVLGIVCQFDKDSAERSELMRP